MKKSIVDCMKNGKGGSHEKVLDGGKKDWQEPISQRYYSRDEADREAERLCQCTGGDFVVLEAIMWVSSPRIPLAWYHIKD